MSIDKPPRWFVAHCHPHSEAKATANLKRQGFDVYYPRLRKQRRHARRVETVAVALFPRYLFVKIDLNSQHWRVICSTLGVDHLICNSDNPTPLPNGVIEASQSCEDASGFIKLDSWQRGSRIRVVDGIFESFTGLFESNERERIAVLLDLMCRKVRVTLDADLVAAA